MSHTFTILQAEKTLQKYWNYPNFREKQQEVLNSMALGANVIALLPTGGGKSICYQVPALLNDGITIVVSPLISLMEDQVAALKAKGLKAEAIHSGHMRSNIDRILDNCIYGAIKLLYVSPERLQHPLFQERMLKMQIDLVAIDEAHCISQWGHDFRPSYMDITSFIKQVKPRQVIALTATATEHVLAEIKEQLFEKTPTVVRGSFLRDNIAIDIINTEDKIGDILRICSDNKKTIIYVRSRRKVKMIADTLKNYDFKVSHYHAGLSYKEKKGIQEKFKNNLLNIVVATNAFGMGIDVPNIRRVIHIDLPPSVEEYYQEIGRGGRDQKPAEAVFLTSKDDIAYSKRRTTEEYPPLDFAFKIYKSIHVFFNIGLHEGEGAIKPLSYTKIVEAIGVNAKKLVANIKLWQKLGVWETSNDSRDRTYCKIAYTPKEARKEEFRIPDLYPTLQFYMRNYEQIFESWVKIEIEKDARRLKLSTAQLEEHIAILKDRGILKLYQLKAGPKITFLQPRLSQAYLNQFSKKYNFLKTLGVQRNQAVVALIETSTCKMNFILNYFGEKTNAVCGTCVSCAEPSKENEKDLLALQRKLNENNEISNSNRYNA